ncbi:hypothetical protein KAU39_02550 [bacterium]|nr:hypothetical protein [bacterium]
MNKKEEKIYLEKFKDQYPDFPKGNIRVPNPKENAPDFLIDDIVFGVEVTEVFKKCFPNQTCKQLIEQERQIVINIARNKCLSAFVPGVSAFIFFNNNKLNKSDRNAVGEKLSNIIKNNIPEIKTLLTIENDLPSQISSIMLYRPKEDCNHHWSTVPVGWLDENLIKILQNALDSKEEKLISKYLKKCSTCWLLITSHGWKPSSFLEASKETINHKYSSSFDKAFYFEGYTERLIELKLIKNA